MKLGLVSSSIILGFVVVGCASGPAGFGGSDAGDGGKPVPVEPDSGTNACAYPTTDVGAKVGAFVDGTLSWSCAGAPVATEDLFDCDGSKGINAIVFDVSAEWCAACVAEATDMKSLAAQYDALGVKFVTLVIQDAGHAPASLSTASAWKQKYNLAVDVCADPGFAFQPSGSGSLNLPYTLVVDPRTMRIVHVAQGYLSRYPLAPDQAVVDLAKRNGAK